MSETPDQQQLEQGRAAWQFVFDQVALRLRSEVDGLFLTGGFVRRPSPNLRALTLRLAVPFPAS